MTDDADDDSSTGEGAAADAVSDDAQEPVAKTAIRVVQPESAGVVDVGTQTRLSEPRGKPEAVAGTVTETIGTGENARHSITFLTIRWCFIFAAVTSLPVAFHDFYLGNGLATSDLKDIWALFSPIVTLGLGYLFGRKE